MIRFTRRDDEIIQIFRNTYNARYLRGLEGDERTKSKKIEKIKEDSNPVQNQLISNLQKQMVEPASYDVRYIEGPMSLTKFKLLDENKNPIKSAYIFGEQHEDKDKIEGSCPPGSIQFQEYIRRLAEDSPAFIDLYIELPIIKDTITLSDKSNFIISDLIGLLYNNPRTLEYVSRGGSGFSVLLNRAKKRIAAGSSSYILDSVHNDFLDCIQPSKRRNNSICNIIRIHSIDIRSSLNSIPNDFLTAMVYIEETINIGIKLKKSPSEILSILIVLRDSIKSNGVKVIDLLIEYMITNQLEELLFNEDYNKMLKKEYGRYDDSDPLKIQIQNFIYKKLRDLPVSVYGSVLKNYLDTPYLVTGISILKNISLCLLKIKVLLVDMYCLLRIFKKYRPKFPEPLNHPDESRNIIIYAGNDHSKNYREFFREVGFQVVHEYRNPIFNSAEDSKGFCVDMHYEKLPRLVMQAPTEQKPPAQTEEEKRLEYIEFLNNSSVSNLKDSLSRLGYDIPQRATKKKLIDLLIEDYDRNNVVDIEVEIEVEQKPQAQTEEEKRLEYIEFLNNSSVSNLKDSLSRLGYDIPPRATKKKLIDLLIENYGR